MQRTVKRTELTAVHCLLKNVIGPIKVHVANEGIVDGLWKGEMRCIDPKAGGMQTCFHCLVEEWKECEELNPKPTGRWTLVYQKREKTKHRTEWCAEANWYRCMRCGRGSKYMKMPGQCTGPKLLSKGLGKWRRRHLGGHDFGRRMDRQRQVLIWCRKCSGKARHRMGPEECLQAEASRNKRAW